MPGNKRRKTGHHPMVLRSEARASHRRTRWASLPPEIRSMILEAIAHQRHPGWASLAAVCREWQQFLESRNFRQLKLTATCLDGLDRMVTRQSQRELVRHIRLNVRLPEYTCKLNSCMYDLLYSGTADPMAGEAVSRLFNILSTWKLPAGLTLELNAFTPSDSEHWFKNLHFGSNDQDQYQDQEQDRDQEGEDASFAQDITTTKWHDPDHGWVNGQQVQGPPLMSIYQIFDQITYDFPKHSPLPQVDAVSCLIIRRQFRRCFGTRTLGHIFRSLCCLEQLVFEPWRDVSDWPTSRLKFHFISAVQNSLPDSLRRLTIFEDFCDYLQMAARLDSEGDPGIGGPLTAYSEIGAAFASRSLHLEQLCLSYMTQAECFFESCEPAWAWPKLECLALTSQFLRSWESRRSVHDLLRTAAVVALRMPRLHTLVIWHGGKGSACAFTFHKDRAGAYIKWRGTWDMDLDHHLVQSWERVAGQNEERGYCPPLRIRNERVREVIESHGDAIHALRLPCEVVTPLSLRQIRVEQTSR